MRNAYVVLIAASALALFSCTKQEEPKTKPVADGVIDSATVPAELNRTKEKQSLNRDGTRKGALSNFLESPNKNRKEEK